MSLNKYYHNMGMAKGLLLMALILIIMGWAACGYCHTFEMDYSGPGSESERSEQNRRDRENLEAAERCDRGEGTQSDYEKAGDYVREHGA